MRYRILSAVIITLSLILRSDRRIRLSVLSLAASGLAKCTQSVMLRTFLEISKQHKVITMLGSRRVAGRCGIVLLCGLLAACSAYDKYTQRETLGTDELAEKGDAQAQLDVGRSFASAGQDAQAIYWLCQASVQGRVDAQLELARLFEQRGGTDAPGGNRLSDVGSAFFWYTAAASQGSDDGLEARSRLAKSMSADEVNRVKQRATRWKQANCGMRP